MTCNRLVVFSRSLASTYKLLTGDIPNAGMFDLIEHFHCSTFLLVRLVSFFIIVLQQDHPVYSNIPIKVLFVRCNVVDWFT